MHCKNVEHTSHERENKLSAMNSLPIEIDRTRVIESYCGGENKVNVVDINCSLSFSLSLSV